MTCSCPDEAFHRGVGGICPLGHYCPEGSDLATQCPAGYYADTTAQSVCTICPARYYCEAGAEEYASTECPIGNIDENIDGILLKKLSLSLNPSLSLSLFYLPVSLLLYITLSLSPLFFSRFLSMTTVQYYP